MKNCIHCGAELPEQASFCPCCTAFQKEKRTLTVNQKPEQLRLWPVLVVLAALAVVLGAALWLWTHGREPSPPPEAAAMEASLPSEIPSPSPSLLPSPSPSPAPSYTAAVTGPVVAHGAMTFHYERTPLDTIGELQALLDLLGMQMMEGDSAVIYLPCTTYEGDLVIPVGNIRILGTSNPGPTTLRGSVTIPQVSSGLVEITGLQVEGNGSGVGLTTAAPTIIQCCTFQNWEVGIEFTDGGWACARHSTFRDNLVGLRMNSAWYNHSDTAFEGNAFLNNGIGVQIFCITGDICLNFQESLFEDNVIDLDNPQGYLVAMPEDPEG